MNSTRAEFTPQGSDIEKKIWKYFVSQKNLSFGINIKPQVPLLTYKFKAHNISGVRS